MKSLPRYLRADAYALGAKNVWFESDRRHPWLVARFDDHTIRIQFSSSSTGNGRYLKNKRAELRRAVCALADAARPPH